MGVMKLLSTKRRARGKGEEDHLHDVPYAKRPPGPVTGPMPAVCPPRASEGCLRAIMAPTPQTVWEAVNTNHRLFLFRTYQAWVGRRGAIFLYNRMVKREMAARGMQFANVPLHCREFDKVVRKDESGGNFVHPVDAKYTACLDSEGRMTPRGLSSLEDVEFVWPWLDELPMQPDTGGGPLAWIDYAQNKELTYLALGLQCEHAWPSHFIGGDSAGRTMSQEEPTTTFALTYAALLKEIGRAGPGTRLGKWLDTWLDRADKEMRRLRP